MFRSQSLRTDDNGILSLQFMIPFGKAGPQMITNGYVEFIVRPYPFIISSPRPLISGSPTAVPAARGRRTMNGVVVVQRVSCIACATFCRSRRATAVSSVPGS